MNMAENAEREDVLANDETRTEETTTETVETNDEQTTTENPEETETGTEGDEEEVVITLGDEEAPSSEDDSGTPQWVKDLRKRTRELERENAALKAGKATEQQKPTTLRAKPTLDDHDFDQDAYEADVEKWFAEKAEHDAHARQAQEQQEAARQQWQAKLDNFGAKKAALRVPDFDDAEAEFSAKLNPAQQAIVVGYANDPALVAYALGKRPEKLAELAKIADPIAFAIAASKLEGELKVTKRTKQKPAPEETVRGGAPLSGGVKDQLKKLEDKAAKTGDRTELIRFKRAHPELANR